MDPRLVKLIEALKALRGLVPGKSEKAELIFTYREQDFPPCHTRVLRQGRGFPWDRQVAGHRNFHGHFELTPWEVKKPGMEKKRLT